MTIDFAPWRRKGTEDQRREHERAIAGDLDQRDEPGTTRNAAAVPADGSAAADAPAVLDPVRGGQGAGWPGMVTDDDRPWWMDGTPQW